MAMPQETRRYTYEDWISWDENVRAEIISGELYMMAPPTQKHQEISGELFGQIWSFLKGKPCKVFSAPFGVRLETADDTVLEPDIIVVCDQTKLDGKVCSGTPDMVIEVLSPSTARIDKILKLNKYQRAGVREYWIADPDTKSVQVFILEDGRYYVTGYTDSDTVPVTVLPGCVINLYDVFN